MRGVNMNKGKKFSREVRNRDRLQEIEGRQFVFKAKVGSRSMTTGYTIGRKPTVELIAVVDNSNQGRVLADHLWVRREEIANPEIIDELIDSSSPDDIKRIVFRGRAYAYCKETRGGTFLGKPKYSIGEIEVIEASAKAPYKKMELAS